MSSRKHTRKHGYPRPDAFDPWEHNRLVARRKKYRALARQFREVGRVSRVAAKSMRQLAQSAERAAASLRQNMRREAA